jgi:hypothetical protein
MGLAAAAVVLFGCAPSPPQFAAVNPRAFVQGPPGMYGDLGSIGRTQRPGELPPISWPNFQAGLATRANEAELAIIWRAHELRERHPGATPGELAEMLIHDDVWEQNAKFVQSARRAVVIREALTLW